MSSDICEPLGLIRRLTADDVGAIVTLEASSFEPAWSGAMVLPEISPPGVGFGLLQSASTRQASIDKRSPIANTLVGYALFRLVLPTAELARVAVDPRKRQRGLGRVLVATALDLLAAEGVTECLLDVRRNNLAARALYQSLGFTAIGLRRSYYAGGEDALVLRLPLTPDLTLSADT